MRKQKSNQIKKKLAISQIVLFVVSVKDVIKVFATISTTNFHWLELPPLDRPRTRSASTRGGPTNPHEELFASIAEEKQKRPSGRPVNRPSKVTADGMYDIAKTRKYNRRRGIKSIYQ
jgi:hypothetical protein